MHPTVQTSTTAEVVGRYYELANAGDWDAWCELFAADQRMDEQLAGRVEGRDRLREMMRGFPQTFAAFANRPAHTVVDGTQATVLSHISARTRAGVRVEADVCNYFQVVDGEITYMKNVHDTVPFADVSRNVRWSHVGLNCRDLAATEEFYTRWFGFRRARVVEDGDTRVVFLRQGGALLELFTSPEPASASASASAPVSGPAPAQQAGTGGDGPRDAGSIRHLAFQVDDVDAFLAEAAGALPISLGPLSFDDAVPGWRTVWVTDPDGIVVEVSQGYVDQ